MTITPAVKSAVDYIRVRLVLLTRTTSEPLPLSSLAQETQRASVDRDGLQQYRKASDTQGRSPAAILSDHYTKAGQADHILGQMAIHSFLCQLPLSFNATDNIQKVASEVETIVLTLSTSPQDDLAGWIENGISQLSSDPAILIAAVDAAFIQTSILPVRLRIKWQVAKDAFELRRLIERRLDVSRRTIERKADVTNDTNAMSLGNSITGPTAQIITFPKTRGFDEVALTEIQKVSIKSDLASHHSVTHHDLEELLNETLVERL